MIRNKHGILCAANVPRKKLAMTATEDVGEYVTNTPKYVFELKKWHDDMQALEIALTPSAKEMRQLQREGFTFTKTHETTRKMEGEMHDDYTASNRK